MKITTCKDNITFSVSSKYYNKKVIEESISDFSEICCIDFSFNEKNDRFQFKISNISDDIQKSSLPYEFLNYIIGMSKK